MKIFATLLLGIALLLSGCSQAPQFVSTDISDVDWGRNLELTDHHGQARQLADFQGKVVFVFFGYVHCPDVCPTTLATMREVLTLLGEDASRVQVLFVTLDPARDTADLLSEYVTAFHPSFLGLLGDEATVATVAKDFKVFYAKQPGTTPDSYGIDHFTGSYAYDPQGRLRLLIRYGEAPENIAADLKLLLAGK